MPQMAPLPWVTLMIITLISLFTISAIIFFSSKSSKTSLPNQQTHKFSIKW